jgi:hypothetical protein
MQRLLQLPQAEFLNLIIRQASANICLAKIDTCDAARTFEREARAQSD